MPKYQIEKTLGPTDGLRLKYPILVVPVIMLALLFIPDINRWILSFDRTSALYLNGWLGRNRMADLLVAGLNSKLGDAVVIISMLTFIFWHSFRVPDLKNRLDRLAFWIWAIILFFFIYQFQRYVEVAFDRDSPGKYFDNWFDLRDAYDVSAKVTNTRSYPSGHAMAYYTFAFLAIRRYRTAGIVLMLIALILPSTRIVTGAHWFSDIFLGSLPISAVAATLALETSLWKIKRVIEKALWDIWFVTTTHHVRPVSDRARAAWREFLSEKRSNNQNDRD